MILFEGLYHYEHVGRRGPSPLIMDVIYRTRIPRVDTVSVQETRKIGEKKYTYVLKIVIFFNVQ